MFSYRIIAISLLSATFSIACTSSPSFTATDSIGSTMRLQIRAPIPDDKARIPLYECKGEFADGLISYKPEGRFLRTKLNFCFESSYGPNSSEVARISQPNTAFEVCVVRETGFCDSGDCMSVFLYDQCASFVDVVNCSNSFDCPIFQSNIREIVSPIEEERDPVMDLIHEVNPEIDE